MSLNSKLDFVPKLKLDFAHEFKLYVLKFELDVHKFKRDFALYIKLDF